MVVDQVIKLHAQKSPSNSRLVIDCVCSPYLFLVYKVQWFCHFFFARSSFTTLALLCVSAGGFTTVAFLQFAMSVLRLGRRRMTMGESIQSMRRRVSLGQFFGDFHEISKKAIDELNQAFRLEKQSDTTRWRLTSSVIFSRTTTRRISICSKAGGSS